MEAGVLGAHGHHVASMGEQQVQENAMIPCLRMAA